jgi:hypothetical protein
MTGSVTFEDSAPDLDPDTEFGVYASILNFSVVIHGLEFAYDARSAAPGSRATLFASDHNDRFPDNGVRFEASGLQPDFLRGLDSGHERVSLTWGWQYDSNDGMQSDAVPKYLPGTNGDIPWGLHVSIHEDTQSLRSADFWADTHITRRLESPVAVPEPAPLPLLALGLATCIAGGWIARRGNRHRPVILHT